MRIVSLVPSHTESLHDLGFAGQVVGRTRFCVAPRPWVDGIPHVGGTKDASLDKILALRPDLVVADKDENPKALVDALGEAGIEVIWSEIDTVQHAADFLVRLADRLGDAAAGRTAAQDIDDAVAEVRPPRRADVWCPIWHAPWMTFDQTSYPHDVLRCVGLDNVFARHAGPKYFEVDAQEVTASGAGWTLLPTEPFPFHKKEVDTSGLGHCGRTERVRVIDGEALTWFGTRTSAGLRELARVAADLQGR